MTRIKGWLSNALCFQTKYTYYIFIKVFAVKLFSKASFRIGSILNSARTRTRYTVYTGYKQTINKGLVNAKQNALNLHCLALTTFL